ncbi:MAG: ABC transporter permease, partial [Clostridia bacterium]|nr:ABC transporter permease [Clostridia bacterium]
TLTKNEGTVEIEKAQYKLNAAKARYSTIDDEYTKLKEETDRKIANLNGDLKKYRAILKNADSMTWEATPQTALAGNKNFSRSLDNVHSISRVFPVLFLLTAMLACFVIMVRNIEEERSTIGIMKAIGYSDFAIFLKYVFYSVIAWTAGALLGVIIGAIFFPAAVSSIYAIIYEIPSIGIVYNPWYVSYGLEASAAAVLAATIAATSRELVYKPAALLRAKNINFSRRVWLERFPGLWDKLNYGMVFVARAVSRSRRRLFVGTVGVACCTALILSAFGLANSADAVSGVQYSKNGVFKYDVQLTLRSAQTSGSSDILESVLNDKRTENAMLISMDTANVSSTQYGSNENYSARIITFDDKDEAGEFVSFKLKEGSAGLDGGVLVSEKLAKNSGARVGESVYLTSADGSVHSVKINGVVKNYINDYVYFSKQCYVETFNDEPALKYIVCNVKDYMSENDIAKFASDYLKLQDITGAATAKNMEESINDSMSRVMAVVVLFIISACVLAGIVMYTVANINISERVREVANIKVVGFSDNEVLLYVSRENIISTIFGLIIGIVFGIFFNSTLVSFISSDTVAYNESLYWWSYVATALIIAVVAVLVSLPLVMKIRKINMAETMKSIEQYS